MAVEIKDYLTVVDRITDYVTTGTYKGQVYGHLADLIDTGPRIVRNVKKKIGTRANLFAKLYICVSYKEEMLDTNS